MKNCLIGMMILWPFSLVGQIKDTADIRSRLMKEYDVFIAFHKNSLRIHSQEYEQLDELGEKLRNQPLLPTDSTNSLVLVLFPVTTKKEYRKNPYIGINRCKVVMDYLREKYNLAPRNMYISNDEPSITDTPMVGYKFIQY